MFGWGKNKNKQKNKSTKPRAAPAAHRHPPYKKNAPRPPTVVQPNNRRVSPQVKYQNNRSQSQQIAPKRESQSNPQKQNKTPPTNINTKKNNENNNNKDDDDDDDESDNMFDGMDMGDDDDDDSEQDETPQDPDAKPKGRQRTMSVEALAKLSEEERLTLALQMSMGTGDDSKPKQPNKELNNNIPITQTVTKKQDIPQPIPQQQVSDIANIQWPTIPNTNDKKEQQIDNGIDENKQSSSAFGFDLSGAAPTDDNINNNNVTKGNDNSSAFGFDLSGNNLQSNPNENTNQNINNDEQEEEEDMFSAMNVSSHREDDQISSIMSASKDINIASVTTPSYGTTNATTASPPPSASLGPVDTSVLSQLKRAEQQHERSRKRIWSQIKQCLEREQRIKERETELRDKLIVENNKKMDAENNKILALKNADFEQAEKTKNIIRRSIKNIQDVNHQLQKYEQDIKKIKYDKSNEEAKYMKKNKSYREKLKLLYDKHENTMTKNIQDEFNRIEREEKKFKEKLERTEREIQLDEENIEKCKEKMEEIEDLIKTDVEPYQENLDKKNTEKSCLLLEIDELNKQLTIKKNELLGIENNINELNSEIQKVRKIYSDQMDEINGEQSRYEQSKDKFNLQKNEFVLLLNGLNNDAIRTKQNETEFEDELNALKLKISKINDSFERFEEKKQRHTEWINEEHRLLENKIKLNKKMEIIKYAIEKYEKELKQIDSKCIQHRSTITTIDSALPILHSDKTTAVNNENYLEAGKIHKQIIHKTTQKEKSMEQLKILNDKTLKIKEKLHSEQNTYSGIKQELSDINIKIHKQRFNLITDERGIIKESISSIQCDHNDVESVVLNLELDQIELELQFFKKQYGWNVSEKPKKYNNQINGLDDVIGNNDTNNTISPNNAEPIDTLMEQIEKKKKKKNKLIIKSPQKRNKKDIENEIKNISDDIILKTTAKEEVQNVINKAVMNDEFMKAGELAPKKRKLINEINELKKRVEQLQVELNEVIDQDEKENDNDNDNDKPGDTIEGDKDNNMEINKDDMDKGEEEVNGMDGYGMLGVNDGYNGIMDKDNEKENNMNNDINIATNNDDIKVNDNNNDNGMEVVDKLTSDNHPSDVDDNNDSNNVIIDNNKEINENNNEEIIEDIVKNENENNGNINEENDNEDDDDDDNNNENDDMFGGMVVGDDEQDIVNID